MTVPEVNNKSLYISITNILNDLYKNVYLICVGDKEHTYSLCELRAIDRLVVWLAQNKLFPKRNRRPNSHV
jgi:hypothetical protein